jgi:hypothetical protein
MCNPIGDSATLNITALNEHFLNNMDNNRHRFEQAANAMKFYFLPTHIFCFLIFLPTHKTHFHFFATARKTQPQKK